MPLLILSKDNDLLGTDKYRDTTKTIPMAYRATIDMSVNQNSTATNNNVTVRSVNPVVKEVAGVTTSQDSFLMVTKFSSLQHITNDTERAACFDKHVAFLLAARASILDGQLPDAPIVLGD